MTENKFNTYLTYLMLDAAKYGNTEKDWWAKNINIKDIESAKYIKITDSSPYSSDYVTIAIAGNGKIFIRKRRK